MALNKEKRQEIKKTAEESPIWGLEMRISSQNKKLLMLKGQGVTAHDSKWESVTQKRNIYRKILLKKLKVWEKNKGIDTNPTHQDYLNSLNWSKEHETKENAVDKLNEGASV